MARGTPTTTNVPTETSAKIACCVQERPFDLSRFLEEVHRAERCARKHVGPFENVSYSVGAISLGISTRDLAYRVVSVSSRDQSLLGPDQLFAIILLRITLDTWLVRRSPFREKLVGNVSPHFDFYQIVSRKNNTPGAPLLWVVRYGP